MFVLQLICVFFTPEPFMSTLQGGKLPWVGRAGTAAVSPLWSHCNRSLHCHTALMCEHLHLLGKASPPAPAVAPSSCIQAFYHWNKNDNDSRKWPFSLEQSWTPHFKGTFIKSLESPIKAACSWRLASLLESWGACVFRGNIYSIKWLGGNGSKSSSLFLCLLFP